jgi:hypothetical protein
MMIVLRIREVAEARGVETAASISRRTDIATGTAYRLWAGDLGSGQSANRDRGVGLLLLYRIAKALGVRIEDLYEVIEDEGESVE